MVLSLVGISIFALLILDFGPGNGLSDVNFAEASVNYLVMGLIFFIAVYFVGSESLEYFRLPRFHFKTALAILIASIFVILSIIDPNCWAGREKSAGPRDFVRGCRYGVYANGDR